MNNSTARQKKQISLYDLVYGRTGRFFIAGLLIAGLFLQPLHQVRANESSPTTDDMVDQSGATTTDALPENTIATDTVSSSSPEEETSPNDIAVDNTNSTTSDMSDKTATSSSADGSSSEPPLEDELGTETTSSAVATSTDKDTPPAASTSTATSSESGAVAATTSVPANTTGTTTDDESDPDTSSGSNGGSVSDTEETLATPSPAGATSTSTSTQEASDTTDASAAEDPLSTPSETVASDIDDPVASSTTGTTTEPQFTEKPKATAAKPAVNNDDNRHQFSDAQCVSVGEGAFYCHADSSTNHDQVETIVDARLSQSGYYDIYLRTAQETINITASQYNDRAPHYDAVSKSVVWHREINGRYQIMAYSLADDTVSQLTDAATHNMEPTRSGEVTVWQQWADGGWRIIMQVGDDPAEQLGDGTLYGVAPYVRYPYVIWQSTTATEEQKVAVYDIESGHVSYIENAESGEVRNPRFVLVYDTMLPNGDVVTQGYNPETGDVQPLSAIPRDPLPEIPSPDPIDEPRAILQQKSGSSTKEVTKTTSGNDSEQKTASTTTTAGVGSSTDMTLDMASTTENPRTLDEYDLVIPSTSTPTTTASST